MRRLSLTFVAVLFLMAPIAVPAQTLEIGPLQIGPNGIRLQDGRSQAMGQCEELRMACENKDRLGEQGEGNCRRYRQTCQQHSRQDMCEESRMACLHREDLGEQGAGNCRKYRESCRR